VVRLGGTVGQRWALESDRAGQVYLAVDVGQEPDAPGAQVVDERVVVLRLSSDGRVTGRLEIPPTSVADEQLHPISVDDEGTVYAMRVGPAGLTVARYRF
jgi:hypothetical protein